MFSVVGLDLRNICRAAVAGQHSAIRELNQITATLTKPNSTKPNQTWQNLTSAKPDQYIPDQTFSQNYNELVIVKNVK